MEARKPPERAVKGVEGGGQGEVEELLGQESAGREVVVGLLRSFGAEPSCGAVKSYSQQGCQVAS